MGGVTYRRADVGVEDKAEREHLPLLLFLGAVFLDCLVDLARCQLVGPVALRFLADDAQHFRLGSSQLHIVTDAEQDRPLRASLLDHK